MIKNCQICKAVINAGNGNTKYCEICRLALAICLQRGFKGK